MALNELDLLLQREERAARHEVETLRDEIAAAELRLTGMRRQLARAESLQSELVSTLLKRDVTPES